MIKSRIIFSIFFIITSLVNTLLLSMDLFDAVKSSDIYLIKSLIENKSDINRPNNYGNIPLHCAIAHNTSDQKKDEIICYLIYQKSDINHQNKYGNIPLYEALYNNNNGENSNCVKLLIEQKSDINQQNKYGNTPLHYALAYNKNGKNIPFIKYLIEQKSDINNKIKGLTFWYFLTMDNKALEIIKYLHEQKIDLKIPDCEGKTIFDYAQVNEELLNGIKNIFN